MLESNDEDLDCDIQQVEWPLVVLPYLVLLIRPVVDEGHMSLTEMTADSHRERSRFKL